MSFRICFSQRIWFLASDPRPSLPVIELWIWVVGAYFHKCTSFLGAVSQMAFSCREVPWGTCLCLSCSGPPLSLCLYFSETKWYTFSLTLRKQLQTLNNLVWIQRCLARSLSLYFHHSASRHHFQVDLSGPTYRLAEFWCHIKVFRNNNENIWFSGLWQRLPKMRRRSPKMLTKEVS